MQQNQVSTSTDGKSPAQIPGTTGPEIAPPAVRERILEEATRLFSTKGYNGLSVREIVEAAGITKPTLYYYFGSKEKLFETIVADTISEFQRYLETLVGSSGSVRERLTRICQAHFDFALRKIEPCRLVYVTYFSNDRNIIDIDLDAHFTRNIELIRDVFHEGTVTGELRAGDPWLTAFHFVGVINFFVMAIIYNPSLVPTEGLAETVVAQTLDGCAVRPAFEHGDSL
jgi:AcrR family transcriptional regulator